MSSFIRSKMLTKSPSPPPQRLTTTSSPPPQRLTTSNKLMIQPSRQENNKLLVISYNEGEQDFYQVDIDNFCTKVFEINPSVIIICTQKSKSQVALAVPGKSMLTGSDSTKHFPHVFGKYLLSKEYKLLYKKDASFMIRGVTENNNVRTRIYIKSGLNISVIKNKLSTNTVGQVSKMSLNRQAIYLEINLNDKKLIVVNTELASYTNGNLGLSDRQKEFMGLIKEFKLHEKYNDGYNIIFCGSLNFKLNPLKMINNEYKLDVFNEIKEYIEKKYISNNTKDLIKYNELKIYIEDLIKKFKKFNNANDGNKENIQKIQKIISPNIYNKIVRTNNLYAVLLEKFLNSLDNTGLKLTCDYNLESKNYRVVNPLKIGSVGKDITKSFNNGHTEYKKNNSTKSGVVSGFAKGFYTGTKSVFSSAAKPVYSTVVSPLSSEETLKKSLNNKQKQNFKLPSMCDRILFALSEYNSINFENFNVYNNLKKSKNKIIYSEFNY